MIDVRFNASLDHEAMSIGSVRKLCIFSVTLRVTTDQRFSEPSRPPDDEETERIRESAYRVNLRRGKFDVGVSRRVYTSLSNGGIDEQTEESTFYLFTRHDARRAAAIKTVHDVMET